MSAEDVELSGEIGGEFEGVIGGGEEPTEVGKGEGAIGQEFEVMAEAVVEDFEVGDLGEVADGTAEEVFEFDAVKGGQDDVGFEFADVDEIFDLLGGVGVHDAGHAGEDIGAAVGEEAAQEELVGLNFVGDEFFEDMVAQGGAKEVAGDEGFSGLDLGDFKEAQDEVEAGLGVGELIVGEVVGAALEPIAGGGGVEFGDVVVENEPFKASSDDFELSVMAAHFGGFGAAEEGELGAFAVGADEGIADGFGGDSFEDGSSLGQAGQSKGFGGWLVGIGLIIFGGHDENPFSWRYPLAMVFRNTQKVRFSQVELDSGWIKAIIGLLLAVGGWRDFNVKPYSIDVYNVFCRS